MKHLNKLEPVKKTVTETPTNKFLDNLFTASSKGKTENEAVTFIRSGSALLDFYAQAGAMRKNPDRALELFKAAFSENREKAIKILFYLRDIRGGQGERDLFRSGLEWIGSNYPEIFEKIVEFVSEYGRWDDIFFVLSCQTDLDVIWCVRLSVHQHHHGRMKLNSVLQSIHHGVDSSDAIRAIADNIYF